MAIERSSDERPVHARPPFDPGDRVYATGAWLICQGGAGETAALAPSDRYTVGWLPVLRAESETEPAPHRTGEGGDSYGDRRGALGGGDPFVERSVERYDRLVSGDDNLVDFRSEVGREHFAEPCRCLERCVLRGSSECIDRVEDRRRVRGY